MHTLSGLCNIIPMVCCCIEHHIFYSVVFHTVSLMHGYQIYRNLEQFILKGGVGLCQDEMDDQEAASGFALHLF